jgi:PAS domain S-box-containing protein
VSPPSEKSTSENNHAGAFDLKGLIHNIELLGPLLATNAQSEESHALIEKCFEEISSIHDLFIGSHQRKLEEAERLTGDILDVILALSSLNFSKSLAVGFEDSGFNAVAAGLNMLGEELQRSTVSIEYVNGILESMNDCLLVFHSDGLVKTINGFCKSLLGLSNDNIGKLSIKDLLTEESYKKINSFFDSPSLAIMRAVDLTFLTTQQKEIPMQVNTSLLRDAAGNHNGFVMVGRDMRESFALIKKARDAALAEKHRAQELSAAHVELERAHEKLTKFNESLQSEINQRLTAEEELRKAHDRLELQVLERTKALRHSNEMLNGEIEERKKAEALLSAREEKFRTIFQTTSVAILDVDLTEIVKIVLMLPADRKKNFKETLEKDDNLKQQLVKAICILDVNDATLAMFAAQSKDDFIDHIVDIFIESSYQFAESFLEALSSQRGYFETSCTLMSLSKKELEVLVQFRVDHSVEGRISGLVTIVDLTEVRLLREQLRQSQKMEAIGRVAGGIAHDFNNLLTVILSYGQMLLDDLAQDDPLRGRISPMVECAERAAALTRQLLAFSRRQVIAPKVIDLNELTSNMERMLKRILGEDIELLSVKDNSLGKISADPGQIEQIIMNLAVNARDAMASGGKLTIETKNVTLTEEDVKEKGDLQAGAYVLLAVSDTGCGMTLEVRQRIFEPFFTTKGVGKGTGLGLSTVYGIVKQSKGHIDVYSEVSYGTVFKIYFSRFDSEEISITNEEVHPESLVGKESILVVEDELTVRTVACAILRKAGYNVLEAGDPLLAVDFITSFNGKIDLLLSDVIMPNMRGPEMADKITGFQPEMKILFMSGYTDNAINRNGILDEGRAFLQKSFTPKSLLSRVREVLAGQENEHALEVQKP